MHFGGVKALDGVSIKAEPGEVTGLIGPNGAGKSTMLGVASGLLRPGSGSVHFAGDDVSAVSACQRARRGIARSFQSPQLVGEMTVLEHIILAQRVGSGGPRLLRDYFVPGRRSDRIDEAERGARLVDSLDIGHLASQTPGALPMGTRRLVEVAQALASKPKVLLLDEPAAGLNEAESEALSKLVHRVADVFGIAVVLVEHDLELVLRISANVFVIDFGRLIGEGPPAQIRNSRKVQEAYVGVGT